MNTDSVVESGVEQTWNIATLSVHRKCTCLLTQHYKTCKT